ncbi:AAA family ATPase [Streptomyces griseoincarnatus]|uniref:AAA family ATPase n=1 Tax=unclassified Streptomyces TaxID=2593676 RepID=UPI000C8828EA|nr:MULTISPECIES: AAA family ATPase [unclassified Streptomyces]MBJ6646098.1 AAA family ATPase [Streptomyces sp. BSE7-9]MCA2203414.1 AAA family ATPase [Streptomyces sp. SMS_SU21]NEA92671.1 AAA domain-containing protein [Actinospica acidiphila]
MTWQPYYVGDGIPRDVDLGDPPPWRSFPRQTLHRQFQPPPGLTTAVNAALALRRPLLVTGPAGSGKSTVIEQVAAELKLGEPLRWHITSRSTLVEALYRYDALGRIHAQRLSGPEGGDDIAPFLQLGPLGTALLPSSRPRALLIDEIDKSDLDLPSDLLDVLERGTYEIAELGRYAEDVVSVREWGSDTRAEIWRGRVQCDQFPFIVMTSNGERDFPSAFLRRCIRFTMPKPNVEALRAVVEAHLGSVLNAGQEPVVDHLVQEFVSRVTAGGSLAVDQLLNAVHLVTGGSALTDADRQEVLDLVLRELSRA